MAIASMPVSKQHPLTLPEIMTQIGRHLPRKSLHACIQVSSAWHCFFIPFVWRSLVLSAYTVVRKPSLDTLAKHASLIRELDFNGPVPAVYFAVGYKHLEKLSITGERATWRTSINADDDPEDPLTSLVRDNTGLKTLYIDDVNPAPTGKFWEAVCRMTKLESLTVCRMTFAARQMPVFWRALSARTSYLRLDRITFMEGDQDDTVEDVVPDGSMFDLQQHRNQHISKPRIFFHLNELSLSKLSGSGSSQQIKILENAPLLTTLYWIGDPTFEFPVASFAYSLNTGTFSRLESLDLRGGTSELGDENLSLILRAMSRLVKLRVPNSGMGPEAMIQLFKNFATVKALDLSGCSRVHSWMIQSILSTFPLLEVFVADTISVKDIIDGDPWICNGLKELRIDIEIGYIKMETEADLDLDADSEGGRIEQLDPKSVLGSGHWQTDVEGLSSQCFVRDERQQIVFERLSRLEQLEELNISLLKDRPFPSTEQMRVGIIPKVLDLRLVNGLHQLRTLKRLRRFYFAGPQEMSELDVLWIMEHWRKLSHISGQLNSNLSVNRELVALLRARPIVTDGW
ncbi:hypothetical protein BGX28_006154 [Mortierella sp. GBA30]|nr:hypothetical protein BGX28_006154 [Mortierella sp. GBA30]